MKEYHFVKRGKCTGSIDETLELGFVPKVSLDETRSRFDLSLISAVNQELSGCEST